MVVQQAYRFALDPTRVQERCLAGHCGAARFAYNWGLGVVKERLDLRAAGEEVEVPWTLPALRREWNRQKHAVAPWWAKYSKECYSSGLAALASGLDAFTKSRRGRRRGRRIGFPRFKRKRGSVPCCRFTTGAIRVDGERRVVLPRLGAIKTHEPVGKLARLLADGNARIHAATVKHERGRWFVSFTCTVTRADQPARQPGSAVGIDVGISNLITPSVGRPVQNPHALELNQRRLRRLNRRLARQLRAGNPDCYDEHRAPVKGRRPSNWSHRALDTKRRIGLVHARVANVRQDAHHQATSRLVRRHGTIVLETLNVAGMLQNRRLARAIADAGLGEIHRQLRYKTEWRGGTVHRAERLYPSSKTCSDCGTVKTKLGLGERTYRCDVCGRQIDRDRNAALNLAALAANATTGAPSGGDPGPAPPGRDARPETHGKTRPRRARGGPRTRQPPTRQTGTARATKRAA